MPRIFKGIESELRLLLHPCILTGEITDIKVALFTNDPSVAIEFTDRYTIDDNILTLKVPTWAFGTMEDGVINYVIQGMHNDDAFITDRQSNYYLKTPTDYIPEEIPEEVVLGELTTMIVENGVFEYTPTDVDAWNKATIEVNVPSEGGSCNLGEGEVVLDTTMAGFYELYAADDGYDGWSKFYVTLENGGAIKVHKASDLLDTFNNGEQIDYGAYYYVGGQITEIEEINTEFGNATYVLDNGFKVYRGDWIDGNPFGEDQIKVGGYIVVYGIIQDYKGTLQFKAHSQVVAYQECEGGEIVSCNLEDKGVNPSINDRDGNGVIVITPSENYDGLLRVVLDPTTIYNEGVTAGKAEGSDLNIDAVSTPLGVGDWNRWTRSAAQFGLDAISEITIDGGDYQEWTKGRTLLEAYNTTDEIHIMENGEYRPVMGYDGFALRGYNVAWITDVIPTIDTDVEIWVKPYDGAPNMWQGFIGSQASDDDNTTFQIRKMDGNNAFCFKFGEQTFDYEFEYERWYRLRMNRRGVWVNGEQVCGWDVQAFEENPNPLMINGIYNLGFEGENYRMNYAAYGYIYFHNSDSLLVPNRNGSFIGDKNRITQRQRTSDATLSGERNYYPNGYTKVTVDVPQNGGGDCNIQPQKKVDLNSSWEVFYPDEGYDGIYEVVVQADAKVEEWREEGRNDVRNKLQSIEITENGRYSTEDQIMVNSLRYNGGYHTDTISTYDINRIEVTFKADTSAAINGQGQPFILGGSLFGVNESGEDNACARAIQYAYGRIVGYWEGKWTGAVTIMDGEWITITLDENGMTVKYPTYEEYCEYLYDNGKVNSGVDIFPFIIGGLGGRAVDESGNYIANLIEDSQFRGLIKEVKVNTNSMGEITYISKNWGYGVWDRLVENTGEYLSALEPTEGEVTMNSEWERKYGEGWREINVNVDGEESMAANARVLDITENGVYVSKYTQDGDIVINSNQQITGVYDDGTNFYDTAELFCSYVQLDVIPTEETRIEFWYLPNKPHMGDGFHQIIQSTNDQIAFVFDGGGVNNKTLRFIFGDKSVSYTPSNIGDEWWHIIVDKNGLIFNGEEFPFDATATFKKADTNVYVNGSMLNSRKANGTFGMVKIGDTTYIPYEGGFLNTNTDVLQPIIQPNLGILEDGTPITKATYLNGAVYDTGLKITEDSTIELWINKYEKEARGYYLYSDLFSVRRDSSCWYVNTAKLNYADSYRNYFEHITISKAGGFVVEGEGTRTMSLDSINFSSGEETIKIRTDNPNFAYGLLKINGNIIVPSEDGFTNLTTNEPLRRCEEWGGTFEYKNAFNRYYSNEITIQREGTLIRSVNVNVVPKIKVADEKFSFRTAQFTKIPEWADIDGIENMSNFFENCGQLTEIRWFDASRTTTMNHTFYNCGQLTHLPPLNTIRVANMSEMLSGCGSLVSVAPLDARNLVRQSYGLFGYSNLNNLTDFGGLIGLKASMDGNYSFDKVPNLTYESCINILNGLYDFVGNGITPASNEGKLKVHSNFLSTVGDEISIGTAKGWTITA